MLRLANKSKYFTNNTIVKCKAFQCFRNHSVANDIGVAEQLPNAEKQFPVAWESAIPYSQIPGPGLFQLLRRFLPGGKYYNSQFIEMNRKLREEYGDIAKLPGILGNGDVVLLFDADDFETLLRTEGLWPVRRGIATFDHYRKQIRPDIFKNMGGLLSEQGQAWYDMRTKVNSIMLKPATANAYIPAVDTIASEFIAQLKPMRNENSELPANFAYELNKWALESIGVIALDQRLNILGGNESEKSKNLIKSVQDFFMLSYELDVLPSIWRYYGTPKYKKLMKCFDDLTETTLYFIDKAKADLRNNPRDTTDGKEPGVLEKLLKIDKHVAMVMALDTLLAGVDTTSSAVANCLYHLSNNPDKQEKLRAEVRTILPELDGKLNAQSFRSTPYLRAVIKEVLRLTPLASGSARGAGRNLVIKGYQIPKGTDLVMTNMLLQNEEKYFTQSDKFVPERWLKENDTANDCPAGKATNPFVYLPFGFGPRSCIGRRFAEMEIHVLLTRIIREFNVEWHHGPMKYKTSFIQSPANDLKFRLTELK